MDVQGTPRRRYRVVVRGRLSDRLGSDFPATELERNAGRTVLSGCADAAHLEDLLDHLLDLGIEPVSVDVED